MENKEIENLEEILEPTVPVKPPSKRSKGGVVGEPSVPLEEEIKPVRKPRTKKNLNIQVTDVKPIEQPEPEQESDNELQAPKPKRVLSERQKETLARGRQIRDEKRKMRAEEKQKVNEERKKEMEEKIVKKAIRIKKKQIKQEQILEPTESETEAEEEIKSIPKPPKLRRQKAIYKPRETQEIQQEQAIPKRKIVFL